MIAELEQRRKKTAEWMEPDSVLIMFSGGIVKYSNDMEYDFQVSRNFYYLTNIDIPEVAFVLAKLKNTVSELLFVPMRDTNYKLYYGEQETLDFYRQISGVNAVLYRSELEGYLEGLFLQFPISTFYIADGTVSMNGMISEEKRFANQIGAHYPGVKIQNLDYQLRNLRLVKSEAEQKLIQKAIEMTEKGILAVMEQICPGQHEYDMAALFDCTVRRCGSEKVPFLITACAENIFAMHYTGDRRELRDGDFFLIDCGASAGHYCADVTRTFPVNGVFSERQKYWYNVCLEVQNLTIRELTAGTRRSDIGKASREYLTSVFGENGYETTPETLRVYNDRAYAFVGSANHSFGLDAHELGDDILLPGMIYTVEPNIFIREEGIGLRIEDDILITEHGPVNLTERIPRTVEAIEAVMKGRG